VITLAVAVSSFGLGYIGIKGYHGGYPGGYGNGTELTYGGSRVIVRAKIIDTTVWLYTLFPG